jgi:hypothetical protein
MFLGFTSSIFYGIISYVQRRVKRKCYKDTSSKLIGNGIKNEKDLTNKF